MTDERYETFLNGFFNRCYLFRIGKDTQLEKPVEIRDKDGNVLIYRTKRVYPRKSAAKSALKNIAKAYMRGKQPQYFSDTEINSFLAKMLEDGELQIVEVEYDK